jgi:hypothetical protein
VREVVSLSLVSERKKNQRGEKRSRATGAEKKKKKERMEKGEWRPK